MTQSIAPLAAPRPAVRLSRPRRILRALAVASCVPYLALKVAWVAGSHIKIPAGSSLLDDRLTMAVINGFSVPLDSAVIVLALVPTRPWGLKVPAWLPAFPVWVATGLMNLAYAGQMLVGLPVAAIGVHYFAERSARAGRRAA